MKTYDDFINILAEWIELFKYVHANRNKEPFNQRLFKKVMQDTFDWFETRPDIRVCKKYDLEIYNYLHEYSIIALKLSDLGWPDNGRKFSASQEIARILIRYIVDPVMKDHYIEKYYIRQQKNNAELVFEKEWADDVKCEYVYDFSTGDIQDFIDYLDILNGKKPQPKKSNITNTVNKRAATKKPAPAAKKAVAKKPAAKTVNQMMQEKKATVKKPAIKKAVSKSKAVSSSKKKK